MSPLPLLPSNPLLPLPPPPLTLPSPPIPLNPPANYHNNPNFVPYELVNEVKKEELRGFSLDLLRYMRVSGFKPSKTRASLQRVVSEPEATSHHRKFSLQFIDKFVEFLSPTKQMGAEFYLKVLFPVMGGYLQKYSAYFMPSGCTQTCSTTSSREEKMMIIK